jgi:hypothetical protein
MKNFIFSDITPCRVLKVNQRYGGTYRLHLQSQKLIQARDHQQAEIYLPEDRNLPTQSYENLKSVFVFGLIAITKDRLELDTCNFVWRWTINTSMNYV